MIMDILVDMKLYALLLAIFATSLLSGCETCPTDRPLILITPDEERVADESIATLIEAKDVYQRGAHLVRVAKDSPTPPGLIRQPGAARIELLPPPALREKLSSLAVYLMGEPAGRHNHDLQIFRIAFHGFAKRLSQLEATPCRRTGNLQNAHLQGDDRARPCWLVGPQHAEWRKASVVQ